MIAPDQAGTIMSHGEVAGTDGDTIGKVGQVYVDNEDGRLTWVTVKTGFFGSNESFVPLDDASFDGSTVTVPYDKAMVKGAPHHAVDAELSVDEENELYSYYGVHHGGVAHTVTSTTGTDTVATGTVDTDTDTDTAARTSADGYLTRSEEQLHVGTRQVEAGRARPKKYVVTEQQQVKEAVRKEQIEVTTDGLENSTTGHTTRGDVDVDNEPSLGDKAKGLVDKAKDALK